MRPFWLFLFLVFPCSVMLAQSSGSPDPSFDGDGFVRIEGTSFLSLTDLQPDGRILDLANTWPGVSPVLRRYMPDGSADASFGTGGELDLDIHTGSERRFYAIEAQTDGKILLLGEVDYLASIKTYMFRLHPDGSPDLSFGLEPFPDSIGSISLLDMELQSDGRILGAGVIRKDYNESCVVVRYLQDGAIDTSFSTQGYKVISLVADIPTYQGEGFTKVRIMPNGNIAAGGEAWIEDIFTTNRYGIISLFDSSGNVISASVPAPLQIGDIAALPDNRFLVSGYFASGSSMRRYDPAGVPDSTYGVNSYVEFTGDFDEQALGWLGVFPDTSCAVGGWVRLPGAMRPRFAIHMLLADGETDSAFGAAGTVVGDTSFEFSNCIQLHLQPDGKILVTGNKEYSSVSSTVFHFLGRFHTAYSVGVEEVIPPSVEVVLFPNPSASEALQLQVSSPGSLPLNVDILDITGRNLYSVSGLKAGGGNAGVLRLEGTAGLAAGVYMVKISGQDFALTRRWVVR